MKLLLKFENGATDEMDLDAAIDDPPDAISFTVSEGVRFYFLFSDELPSGRFLFVETTKAKAHQAIE